MWHISSFLRSLLTSISFFEAPDSGNLLRHHNSTYLHSYNHVIMGKELNIPHNLTIFPNVFQYFRRYHLVVPVLTIQTQQVQVD